MEQPTYRFPDPRRKKKQKWQQCPAGGEAPFPIPVASIGGLPASNDRWNYFTGRFVGSCVYVDDTANASLLYEMGFFGKGQLSRSGLEQGIKDQQRFSYMSKRRYHTHLKWAGGTVETEDSLFPYPRKDNKSLVTDTSLLTLPVASGAGISEIAQSQTLSGIPEQFILVQYTKSQDDTWETCTPSDTEAFWGYSRTKTSSGVEEKMCTEVSETSNSLEQLAESQVDVWATRDSKDCETFWGQSRTEVVSAIDQQMCLDIVGNVADAVADESAEFTAAACNIEPQTSAMDATSFCGNIQDSISTSTQGIISDNKDLTDLAMEPLSAADGDNVKHVDKQLELSTQNVVTDSVFIAATDTVSQANILSTKEDICLGFRTEMLTFNTDIDNIIVASISTDSQPSILSTAESIFSDHMDADMPDTVSSCQKAGCHAEIDDINVDTTVKTDDDDDGNGNDSDNGSAAADILVVDDTEDSDADENSMIASPLSPWQTMMTKDPYPVKEQLLLSLEEAFFLSYGLGCLVVCDSDEVSMDLVRMWRAFCHISSEFPEHYVAYHNFRSKGWVPKTGLKYGTDFVLYKQGPPFYHASYSVIVKRVDHSSFGSSSADMSSSWTSLAALNRITQHVAKELMICYVIAPENVDLLTPSCIDKFTVMELVVNRWVSKKERENSEHFLIP